jgi:two-component system LytT family sensor kinase
MTHVLIWSAFGLFFYRQFFLAEAHIPLEYWGKQTVTLSLLISAFYFNSFVLVPRLLLKNHTAIYIVIIVAIVVAIAFINRWLDDAFYPYRFTAPFFDDNQVSASRRLRPRQPPRPQPGLPLRMGDLFTMIITILVVGISSTITIVQKLQQDIQQRRELEKDKVTTELSLLKAQINPHFFFNTLNNIYALTAINPKVAGEAIHQLSKMMRYLLYDTGKGQNLLSHEIEFVKNYINLMKLRLTDAVQIKIDLPKYQHDLPLAPMIFLPFVENAFKHGVSATEPSYININISENNKVLTMVVNNAIMKDNNISLDTNSGIGLVNTRRRLDLLYPGKYTLKISESPFTSGYTVHLVIDLS